MRSVKKILRCYVICVVIILVHGCMRRNVSLVADVDISGWDKETTYWVAYDNDDTTSLRNLSVFVLNERSVAALLDSIPLTITTLTPDSLIYSEQWTLYPDRSKDDAAIVFYEAMRPYRSRVNLMRKGSYTFTFSHRNSTPIIGIRGVGMEIISNN